MGFFDWLSQDALIEEAEGKRGDQYVQERALRRLHELTPSTKLAACYERIILGDYSPDAKSRAVSNLGNLYDAHYRNAYLRAFEEAARQNKRPSGLFSENQYWDLRPESAVPIIRAARHLISHGDGHDRRLDTCKFMLRKIGTSEALSALRSLDADIAKLRQGNVPSLRSTGLTSTDRNEVVDAAEKLILLLPDPGARKALKAIKNAPDRKLSYTMYYETDDGNQSIMTAETSSSLLSHALSEPAKRQWASL